MKRVLTCICFFWCALSALWAQKGKTFDIDIDTVNDISYASQGLSNIDLVYGDPTQCAAGYLVYVKPHPERAYVSRYPPPKKLNDKNFTVWIEAGRVENSVWNTYGLFHTAQQTLKYLSVFRRDASMFAIFIPYDDMKLHRKTDAKGNIVDEIDIRFSFAINNDAKWPMEKAYTSSGWLQDEYPTYRLTHRPSFLDVKVEGAEDGNSYMKEHSRKDYFFKELDPYSDGWFLHMSYQDKNYLSTRLNDNHYVILTLWKDEEHTQPLQISYDKENLWIGGFNMDASKMEERFNYVAYPHKGFRDWSLFVPWFAINYWRKEGITPTKDNHTCKVYFTLTLSNDGKTPSIMRPHDCNGWIAINLDYQENQDNTPIPLKHTEKKCSHPKAFWDVGNDYRKEFCYAPSIGCTRCFNLYWEWATCTKCMETIYHNTISEPLRSYCLNHDLQEVSRTLKGAIIQIKGCNIVETKVSDVKLKCATECCDYTETKPIYETSITPTPCRPKVVEPTEPEPEAKCPPHDWDKGTPVKISEIAEYYTVNGIKWKCIYDVMEQKATCKRCGLSNPTNRFRIPSSSGCIPYPPTPEPKPMCPPHQWTYYDSGWYREAPTKEMHKVVVPVFDKDSLCFAVDSVDFRFDRIKKDICMSVQPVSRKQWLALFADNNYMGILKEDEGKLNNITYQEAYNFIAALNKKATERLNLNVLFSLPSIDEMRKLVKKEQLQDDPRCVQHITSFFVDSIAVYDGKGRLLTDEQLSTAPEGAKVRVMVGVMGLDGQVTMVDVETANLNTGFLLKGVPFESEAIQTVIKPGRLYKVYYRQCNKCGKIENISENIFQNMRYHRPLTSQ